MTPQNHLYSISRLCYHLCDRPVEGTWKFSATLILCPIFIGSVDVLALLCLSIPCSVLRARGCVHSNKSWVYRSHRGNWLQFFFFSLFKNLILQWFLFVLRKYPRNTVSGNMNHLENKSSWRLQLPPWVWWHLRSTVLCCRCFTWCVALLWRVALEEP